MVHSLRTIIPLFALAAVAFPQLAEGQDQVPSPEAHFGFEMGTDGELADWKSLVAYYDRVAAASPRVTVDTLGTSTLGEPFVRLIVTDPDNHERLDRYREIQQRLVDPRTIEDEEEREALMDEGRAVVLVTSHIHSTEVGAGQMPPRLLHHLATSSSSRTRTILEEVILVVIPSLNPDGTQMVAEWWDRWRGTRYEGAPLPRLYHHYTGHDNNRDWYAFTQVETEMTVKEAHNAWRPHIVYDVHQMGPTGARFFIPPYLDPVEPNVDPLLVSALNRLGMSVADDLTRDGKDGVVVNAIFDIYTPARAYMHYYGGVRILAEAASADWARPVHLGPGQLEAGEGYDPRVAAWNHPSPWQGGRWGLDDIVDYMEAGALSVLEHAARNRRFWIENGHQVARRAVEGWWEDRPAAWVLSGDPDENPGLRTALRILRMGDVEVHRAESSFRAPVAPNADHQRSGHDFAGLGGVPPSDQTASFPEGSFVIPMDQPFASFAQTLLAIVEYPAAQNGAGSRARRPYDATAHNLPLLMGFEAVPLDRVPDVPLSDPIPVPDRDYQAPRALAGEGAPRIGLYRAYMEPMPQGWQRWVFDEHGIEYDEVRNEDIQAGDLHERYDVILFQDQSRSSILTGWPRRSMPGAYAGGVDHDGVEALREFVRAGGRLVAVGGATDFAVTAFDLPVRNVVQGLGQDRFFIPGSILAVELVDDHPMADAVEDNPLPVWFWTTSRAFEVMDPAARIVARYTGPDPLLAGWGVGTEHIAEYAALAELPYGDGSVVLFGFQPNFRGQTVATWPLLFNALVE